MRCLIVDDSRAMRIILKKIMTDLGFTTTEAGHGREALERLSELQTVDIALVDWNMPEMDGLEFVKAVRTNHAWANVKIMMVSAENDMVKIARALMVGADEYAMKPVTKEILVEKLEVMGIRRPVVS